MTDATRQERRSARSIALEAGDRIGSYTLTGRVIGSGGFGSVYEATHPTLEMRVAIKVQDSSGDTTARERALREATSLARIQHRNIVKVFDAGDLDHGRQYIAMELLTGEPLDNVLAAGPFALERVGAILTAIASALDAVHARGLVHRDLKPSNIILCRDDDGEMYPKLIDFGIAKDLAVPQGQSLTRTGAFIGTPQYMSPEQCAGDRPIDVRSDIYAFGLLGYHLLAGQPPFDGNIIDVAHKHIHDPVPSIRLLRPELPTALDAVFARVLAKEPSDRPSSASEASELLLAALATRAEAETRPRWRLRLVAAAAVITVGVASVAIVQSRERAQNDQNTPLRGSSVVSPVDAPPDSNPLDAAVDAPVSPRDAAVDASVPADAAQRHHPQKRRAGIDDVEDLPANRTPKRTVGGDAQPPP